MPIGEPEIAILVEGGMVVSVATAQEQFTYRIIDLDACRVGSKEVRDLEADTTNTDIEEYTDMVLREEGIENDRK